MKTARFLERARSSPAHLDDFDLAGSDGRAPPDLLVGGLSRTDAAVVLDRALVGLAAAHARIRLVQAKLVRRLIDLRGWTDAGFARLSDYGREMLGIAARTLEDDARVVRALDSLPKLRGMLESGALNWSRARVLVRVATAANEDRLLAESANVPLRELDGFVRGFAVLPAARANACAPVACSNDPEPLIRWTISISCSGRRLWRAACEMASRMAGKHLSRGEVLELVAAEASGSLSPYGPDAGIPPPELHEQRFRERHRHDEERGRRTLLEFLAEAGVTEGFAWLDPAPREPGSAAHLDALLDGLDHARPNDVTRRLVELRNFARTIDSQMAALLFIGIDRRLFRELGFATVRLYVEARLGCCSRAVWSMVAVERESWRRSPLLREAWRSGRITHLQAVELLPVISEANAQAWIDHASKCTLRKLEDDVAWALDHGAALLPPPDDTDVRAAAVGDIDPAEVQKRAHGDVVAEWLGAQGAVRIECPVPLSVAVLVESTIDRLQRPKEERWQTFERMVALALLEWMSQPRHRDPIFERDGWRCAVPGCTSRSNLHDHHVVFRSHGGGNARDNRTTVCASHHLHGTHRGRIRATGRAPDGILWELGCAPGEGPLMRLHGDRVMERWAA